MELIDINPRSEPMTIELNGTTINLITTKNIIRIEEKQIKLKTL